MSVKEDGIGAPIQLFYLIRDLAAECLSAFNKDAEIGRFFYPLYLLYVKRCQTLAEVKIFRLFGIETDVPLPAISFTDIE